MRNILIIILAATCLIAKTATARECHLPKEWQKLCPVLELRVNQTDHKMKLQEQEAIEFEDYLQNLHFDFLYLTKSQVLLPKTTSELLMATYKRGLDKSEADQMAKYLITLAEYYQFRNLPHFDNNTSHIIGREWPEIDYSGENMTWQGQKQKYAPYGIVNFKSVAYLEKFFAIESKLPYFTKIYQPQIL